MVTGFTVPSRVICRINIIQLRRRVDGGCLSPFFNRPGDSAWGREPELPQIEIVCG
jgi:hypothetical protein